MIENVRLDPAGSHVLWENGDGLHTRPADALLTHLVGERDAWRAAALSYGNMIKVSADRDAKEER